MKKILVCPDSFKGSLTSEEAIEAISSGLREAGFKGDIDTCEMSDGGEGFDKIIQSHENVKKVEVKTVDALHRPIVAEYLLDSGQKFAYIESARSIGIEKLTVEEKNPLATSSIGLGLMITDAVKKDVNEIYISLGGSATVDGGMGMMTALGIEFKDHNGNILLSNGHSLNMIADIMADKIDNDLTKLKFHAVCDVENPLLGKSGAVNIFAVQKGAGLRDLPYLEKGMKNLSEVLIKKGLARESDINNKGAGAAGGLGFALQTVFHADYISGIDFIKNLMKFSKKVSGSDLIITGEGCVDAQSLMGKVLSGILEEASKYDVPVVSFCGKVKNKTILLKNNLKEIIEISDPHLSDKENMEKPVAFRHLKNAVKKYYNSLSEENSEQPAPRG